MSIYKKDIWKNKKLAIFLYGYLIEGMLGILFYSLLVWFIIFPPTGILVALVAGHYLVFPMKFFMPLMYLLSVAVVTIASLYQAHKLKISKMDVLKGVPCYFLLTIVDCVLFLDAFIKEWILKRKLEVWEKGH